jgi:hypothetical protein
MLQFSFMLNEPKVCEAKILYIASYFAYYLGFILAVPCFTVTDTNPLFVHLTRAPSATGISVLQPQSRMHEYWNLHCGDKFQLQKYEQVCKIIDTSITASYEISSSSSSSSSSALQRLDSYLFRVHDLFLNNLLIFFYFLVYNEVQLFRIQFTLP